MTFSFIIPIHKMLNSLSDGRSWFQAQGEWNSTTK
jgi:hypothetical protein